MSCLFDFQAFLCISLTLYTTDMRKELFESNPLLRLAVEFSVSAIDYCERLELSRKFVIARQLLKSATSIGANAMEAQNAESKADFVHKIKIASKEADETQYWLMLCKQSPGYPDPDLLTEKLNGINRLLGSILKTAKQRSHQS